MNEETYAHIRDKILDYLSRQGFSEKKLLHKVTDLRRRYPHTNRYAGYIASNVLKVIGDLKKEGIINDEAFARDVLRQLKDKKDGPERIRQKMYRRLIPKGIIEKVMQEFAADSFQQDFSSIVRDVRRKKEDLVDKYGRSRKASYVIWQKVYAYIAQKGYYPDDVRIIMHKAGVDTKGNTDVEEDGLQE